MKRIFVGLICLTAIVSLVFVLMRELFPVPFAGEIVQTWETSDTPLKIRINMHIERGGFRPVLGGAYYEFQAMAAGTDYWREVMTFRHDDPVDIPQDAVHCANGQIASVFMGWLYSVTTDGGKTWRTTDISGFL